jgi:hypothetical protein
MRGTHPIASIIIKLRSAIISPVREQEGEASLKHISTWASKPLIAVIGSCPGRRLPGLPERLASTNQALSFASDINWGVFLANTCVDWGESL